MKTATKIRKVRRSANRGYWHRAGRGWYTSDRSPLVDEAGQHLRDKNTPHEVLKKAHARWLLARQRNQEKEANKDRTTVAECCRLFLEYCQANNRPKTFEIRRD